jgi:hypothetical protein
VNNDGVAGIKGAKFKKQKLERWHKEMRKDSSQDFTPISQSLIEGMDREEFLVSIIAKLEDSRSRLRTISTAKHVGRGIFMGPFRRYGRRLAHPIGGVGRRCLRR